MIAGNIGHHGNFWMIIIDGAIAFIRFDNRDLTTATNGIAKIVMTNKIFHDPAVNDGGIATCDRQDMADHPGHG